MTKFVVELENGSNTYWLASTTWAYSLPRAQVFESQEDATAALEKAKPYTKKALFKNAKIVPLAD